MSLITQMLNDLDKRGAQANKPIDPLATAVRSAAARQSSNLGPSLIIAALILVAGGVAIAWMRGGAPDNASPSLAVAEPAPAQPATTLPTDSVVARAEQGAPARPAATPAVVAQSSPAPASAPAPAPTVAPSPARSPTPSAPTAPAAVSSPSQHAPSQPTVAHAAAAHREPAAVKTPKPEATVAATVTKPAAAIATATKAAPVSKKLIDESTDAAPPPRPVAPKATSPAPAVAPPAPARSETLAAKKDAGTVSASAAMKVVRPDQRAENLYKQAVAQLMQGRQHDAIESLNQALAINPAHHDARILQSVTYADMARPERAVSVLEAGIAAYPEYLPYTMSLARHYAGRRQIDAAIAAAQKAASVAGEDPDYHALLGALLQKKARHAEAADHYLIALRGDPMQATWLIGAAISLQSTGRNADAARAYQRALETGDLSPEVTDFAVQNLGKLR